MLDRKYEFLINVPADTAPLTLTPKVIETLAACGLNTFQTHILQGYHNGRHEARLAVVFYVTGEADPKEPVIAMQTATALAKACEVDGVVWTASVCHTGWADKDGGQFFSSSEPAAPVEPSQIIQLDS